MAAYAVAYGLVGAPLLGFGASPDGALVESVALETDDPVDDIKVSFNSGTTAFVQAKRTLKKGVQFNRAVKQWSEAVRVGLDPDSQRLVIVTGSLSGPLHTLQHVLEVLKQDLHAELSPDESAELSYLDALLTELNEDQRLLIRQCASIHVLDVEEFTSPGAREGALLLAQITGVANNVDAWLTLVRLAGHAARFRGGYKCGGWLSELRKSGVVIDNLGDTLAAALERRHDALERYMELLVLRGSRVDLRSLGAELPPLALSEVDSDIEVQIDKDDSRHGEQLLWAYLRRGRLILTGLPGGGKSTSLAILASRLTELTDAPLPVTASLKRVDGLKHSSSFRDRLLEDALTGLSSSDANLVRQEIEDRFHSGGVTLILDSLDETYARRGVVVSELESFLETISDDVDVVLATRDVAYGQAATLQWPALRLMAPKDLTKSIKAILVRAADMEFGQPSDGNLAAIREWIAARQEWILDSINSDSTLVETPLLPILLTLLSIERDPSTLPTGRASILWAVVTDVVKRREAQRDSAFASGDLITASMTLAALDVFGIEGQLIVANGGQVPRTEIKDAFRNYLRETWSLADGPAQVTADALIHFWDETGIFVMSGKEELISARLILFAEIGDAYAATSLPPTELRRWLEERAAIHSLESLILAAGLSDASANGLAVLASEDNNRELLHAVAKALKQGASLEQDNLESLCEGIAADVAEGGREGWESWMLLYGLPSVTKNAEQMETFLEVFHDDYMVLGKALIDLRWSSPEDLVTSPDRLLDLLKLEQLGRLSSRTDAKQPGLTATLVVSRDFTNAKIEAARVLLGHVEAAIAPILKSLKSLPMNGSRELTKLLEERGFHAEVEEALRSDREALVKTMERWSKLDIHSHQQVLMRLAEVSGGHLTFSQRNRLDELAMFFETLNLDSLTAWPATLDDFFATMDLLMTLGDFDSEVLGSQASIVLRRIEESGEPHNPYLALFDAAESVELNRWDQVEDRTAAVTILVDMLRRTIDAARVAAVAMWHAPIAEIAAPRLRTLIPRLDKFHDHQRIAALVLSHLDGQPEPECWKNSENPLLRSIFAETCEAIAGKVISPMLRELLEDEDGNVQDCAVRRLRELDADDKVLVLTEISERLDPGWKCWSCGTCNQPGVRVCAQPDCHRSAPSPARTALEVLEGKAEARAIPHFNFDVGHEG